MNNIRLMLVDDHELIRTGIKTFLESQSGLSVIAEASNGKQAIEIALQVRPDIIIMDISMPEMDGLEATRQLKSEWPEAVVLALTVHADKYYFMEMLAAGASGYLTKQSVSDELIQAIYTMAEGHIYLQPALARWLLEDYQSLVQITGKSPSTSSEFNQDMVSLDILSERERQVLEGVAKGKTNQEIGDQFQLSPKTIARHRERIMKKLNLHSRTELVKFAIRTGLISNT